MPAKVSAISKAVKAIKSLQLGKSEYVPWGETSYLLEKEDLNLLPRAHLRRHLLARGDNNAGKRVELCGRLEKSIKSEIEEQQRVEEEREKKHKEIVALEEKGAVYCVGSNHRGQLGLGDLEHRFMFTPIPMTRGLGIRLVSTRNDTVFAISESHCVYTWGSGGTGPMALCKEKRSNFETAQFIESLDEEDIIDVVVGLNHACARNEIAVYSWGCGQSGCLGNDNMAIQDLPDLVSFETHEAMTKVVSGEMHCAALSESGKVWTWGLCANGRLGSGIQTGIVPIPKEIKFPVDIVMISCGSEHTVASSKSRVFSWGTNDGGRLGHGDCIDRFKPSEVLSLSIGLSILDISCGTWHSACIAASPPMKDCGWLYTW